MKTRSNDCYTYLIEKIVNFDIDYLYSSSTGTGLQSQLEPRYVAICSELSLGFSSPLKFQWKIFNGGPSGRIDEERRQIGSAPSRTRNRRRESEVEGGEEVVFSLEAIKANSGQFDRCYTVPALTDISMSVMVCQACS